MSLIRPRLFPRSSLFRDMDLDMDTWMRRSAGATTASSAVDKLFDSKFDSKFGSKFDLDWFDPFDDLDWKFGSNFFWLNKPKFLTSSLLGGSSALTTTSAATALTNATSTQPKIQNKFRIAIDCSGYNQNSIKISVSEDKSKLSVVGRDKDNVNTNDDDYVYKEFKKTFKLPKNVQLDQMVSFVTSFSQLVIEIPIGEEEVKTIESQTSALKLNADDQHPRILDNKEVVMNLSIPKEIDPSKIKVTVKDGRDVVIQAETVQENQDKFSQTYFYRKCTLPENTDFNSLNCVYENGGLLSLRAPLLNPALGDSKTKIAVEFNK
jgi:HSP20 family molecular chaperone IbpA